MSENVKNCRGIRDGICYIVGAGEPFLPFYPKENDYVIAADGGYERLLSAGIRTDLLLGDFDSLPDGLLPLATARRVERHPVRKDDTDTALAALRAYELGYRRMILLGGAGGREDHTFANYQLLLRLRRMGCAALLLGESACVRVVENESVVLSGQIGDTLSVFAFGREAHGVTLCGVEYPLENGELTVEVALGVSNAFASPVAEIGVRDGALLVFSPLPDLKEIAL